MKRILLIAAAVAASSLLVGCKNEEYEKKKANPDITVIGTFDGCEVKYVDRYYSSDSFYLARCGDTTAVTGRVRSGKTTRNSLTITQEINRLTAERDAAMIQENALSKLTADERKALGIEK